MNADSQPGVDALRAATTETRAEARETIGDVGSAIAGSAKGGAAGKIAVLRSGWRLVRRYPVPALALIGVGVAFWMISRRHGSAQNASARPW